MVSQRSAIKSLKESSNRRSGKVLVMTAILLPFVIFPFTAIAMDLAYLRAMKKELQNAADAAALAGVTGLPFHSDVVTAAQQYAGKNMPAASGHGTVLAANDIFVGRWDAQSRTFTPNQTPWNAVRVVTQRAAANDNPAPLFFASIFNQNVSDVAAEAVATSSGSGTGSRFLLDEEMWDTDVEDIEDLADELGVDPEDLLTDSDGDWFIDIPPGSIVELPTGQVQDEGIFDMDHPAFPFGLGTDPSFADFLNYNEDSNSWRYDLIPKEMLDPLLGVAPVNDPSLYPGFVDPDFVHVSPVFKSDVNELNPVNGTPAVNALGWRRGLVAYKIIGVGPDPPGSYLPPLIIEIVDPSQIDVAGVKPWRLADASNRLVW